MAQPNDNRPTLRGTLYVEYDPNEETPRQALDRWRSAGGIREFIREAPRVSEEIATLRDQFAMAALNGYPALSYNLNVEATCEAMAKLVYEFADAMMEARKVKP